MSVRLNVLLLCLTVLLLCLTVLWLAGTDNSFAVTDSYVIVNNFHFSVTDSFAPFLTEWFVTLDRLFFWWLTVLYLYRCALNDSKIVLFWLFCCFDSFSFWQTVLSPWKFYYKCVQVMTGLLTVAFYDLHICWLEWLTVLLLWSTVNFLSNDRGGGAVG